MRQIFILIIAGTIVNSEVKGQSSVTVIPATTTIESFSNMLKGNYRFYTSINKDTVNMIKDTLPACPVRPDRFVIGVSINPKTNTLIATYNDSSTSILTLKNVIFIQ